MPSHPNPLNDKVTQAYYAARNLINDTIKRTYPVGAIIEA